MSKYEDLYETFYEHELGEPASTADRFFEELMGEPAERREFEEDCHSYEAVEAPPAPTTPINVPAGFRMGAWIDVGGRSLLFPEGFIWRAEAMSAPIQSVETNRRPAGPFDSRTTCGRTSCAPTPLSAAVAHLCR